MKNIGDILITEGMEISGENILVRTLRWARSECSNIPPLKMRLKKNFLPAAVWVREWQRGGVASLAEQKLWAGY